MTPPSASAENEASTGGANNPLRRRSWTLETRVFVLVSAINAVLFLAGVAFFISNRAETEEARAREQVVSFMLGRLPRGLRDTRLGELLRGTQWEFMEDCVLMDKRFEYDPESGIVVPSLLTCNPLGVAGRAPSFDEQVPLRAIAQAVRERGIVRTGKGAFAFPILSEDGAWGGLWLKANVQVRKGEVLLSLLPWFLLSTLLLTLGTFWSLRRLVLQPVERLAERARSVGAGDYSVTFEPHAGDAPELRSLARTFDEMTRRVGGFNATLQDEVRVASEKARQAEAALMTQRRLAAMGELAAGIAHEINNPLGGLTNAVEMLDSPDISAERRTRYLGLLRRGLGRIGETVNRLQRFTPRARPEAVALELREMVQDAIDLVVYRARELGVEISLQSAEHTLVRGARTELGQAVLNLLTNSLDALAERDAGGAIDVTLERKADVVVLTVRDDGPGVSKENLPRVADLFFTTKEVDKGTGLGLALVHNVVEAHGGTVSLDSVENSYFRVTLAFPALDSTDGDQQDGGL